MKIIYRNYLYLFLSSQSRRFEIIKPVFVGFLVSESVGKVWNLITNLTQSLNSTT